MSDKPKKQRYRDIHGTTRVGDFLRKLKGVAPEILEIASKATGIEALNTLAEKIKGTDTISEEDKQKALIELQFDMLEEQEISSRWKYDMQSDSWWSKNIRPLSLAFLTLSLFIYVILDASVKGFVIAPEWIDLLSSLLLLVYGGYFGARAVEKVAKMRYDKK